MKKTTLIVSVVLAACACVSCAKVQPSGKNDASKKFFDAWIKLYHPDAEKDPIGLYVLDEKQGGGIPAGDAKAYPYVYINYTVTDLEGNIADTSYPEVAQQVGTYSEADYYGPEVMMRGGNGMKAGLERIVERLRVGGTITAAVPGWLDTQYRYDDENGYLNNVTGTDYIYSITLEEVISDMAEYQIDSIESYLSRNFASSPDSVMFGYYYIQTKAPDDDTALDKSGSVYVNYTGSLLNGLVFDTTDEKTAKDSHLYSAGKTYEAYKVTLNEDYKEMDTVQGFSYCVSNMKKGEKGICIFYSNLGYEGSSKTNIPAFSPLRFDIEMVGTE